MVSLTPRYYTAMLFLAFLSWVDPDNHVREISFINSFLEKVNEESVIEDTTGDVSLLKKESGIDFAGSSNRAEKRRSEFRSMLIRNKLSENKELFFTVKPKLVIILNSIISRIPSRESYRAILPFLSLMGMALLDDTYWKQITKFLDIVSSNRSVSLQTLANKNVTAAMEESPFSGSEKNRIILETFKKSFLRDGSNKTTDKLSEKTDLFRTIKNVFTETM